MSGNLFKPLQIGPVIARNRVIFGPHTTEFGEHNRPSERHVPYYAERARGGAGLIITESSYVHPTAQSKANSILSYDPGCIPMFRRIAEAVHEHGAKVFGQLSHRGRQMTGVHSKRPIWGVSPIACPVNKEIPVEIGEPEIAELLDGYARAAENYAEAGYDGCEIHAAHGYLLEQFWSPWTNKRTDQYGGSLENRIRFSEQVIETVRRHLPPTMAVGMRVSADELVEGGLGLAEMIEVCQLITSRNKLDYFSVSIGTHSSNYVMIGDMTVPQGFNVPLAAQIKAGVPVPVFVGLRIKEPVMAEQIIAEGKADAVVMVRTLIADPEWANKAQQGKEADIRHCLGCNQDCRTHHRGIAISCVQNPAVGREQALGIGTMPPLAGGPRHVVVVGGGPAGMEAARVAALRGHRVTLLESDAVLGGQVNVAIRVDSRSDLSELIRFRVHQLEALGVRAVLGHTATVDSIAALGPDAVVFALGSRPAPAGIPVEGSTPIRFLSVHDVLTSAGLKGRRFVIYDTMDGFWPACSTAEYLALQGHEVLFVTSMLQVGLNLPKESVRRFFQVTLKNGVRFLTMTKLQRVAGDRITLANTYSGETMELDGYDAIITAERRSDPTLVRAFRNQYPQIPVHLAGDILSPRTAGEAVREGHAVGRAV